LGHYLVTVIERPCWLARVFLRWRGRAVMFHGTAGVGGGQARWRCIPGMRPATPSEVCFLIDAVIAHRRSERDYPPPRQRPELP